MRNDNLVGPVDQGFSVTTLKMYVDALLADRQRQHDALVVHYDERFASNLRTREEGKQQFILLLHEYDRRYERQFVDLKEFMDDSFVANDKANSAALAATKEAVNKAEASVDKRLEAVNEFRGQQTDLQRTYMPRAEAEALIKAIIEKYDALLKATNDKIESLEKAMNDKVDANTKRIDARDNVATGNNQSWAVIAAVIASVLAVAGFITAIIFAVMK